MVGAFDPVRKVGDIDSIYTRYKAVNNPYQKYYFKGSLLAEDNDPQKNETRMDRFYNLIDSINSNTEQIIESSTENSNSKYKDVYFEVPTVEETESGTREEPKESEKSEEAVPDYPSPNIDNPIIDNTRGQENVRGGQNQSLAYVKLEDLIEQNPYLKKFFKISSGERDNSGGNKKTNHNPDYARAQGHKMHAYDITPVGNQTYYQLYDFITTDPIMTRWMIDNRLNILDEERNPKKWYWHGSHLHIGPDVNVQDGISGYLRNTRSTTWRTLKERLGQV